MAWHERAPLPKAARILVPIPPLCRFRAGFRSSGTVWFAGEAEGRKRRVEWNWN